MLPAIELPAPVSRTMSGVIRKAKRWFSCPVTLMYARATLKLLGDTVFPAASVIVGANVFVKSASSVPPARTLGVSSGAGVVGVGVTCAYDGAAVRISTIAIPHRHRTAPSSAVRTAPQCSPAARALGTAAEFA